MSFGDFLTAAGALSGNQYLDFAGRALGAYGDYQNAQTANQERIAQTEFQNNIQTEQLRQSAQEQADQIALRNRLLQQSSNLADALGQMYDYLGMPPTVDARQVVGDYMNLRQNAYGDLDRLVSMVSSTARAKNISRGLGNSTAQDMSDQAIIRKYYPEYQKADQAAYDAAINRNKAMMGLFSDNRKMFTDQVKDRYGQQLAAETAIYNKNYAPNRAAYQPNAVQNANTVTSSAMSKYGDSAGQFIERMQGGAYDDMFKKFSGLFGDGEEEVAGIAT